MSKIALKCPRKHHATDSVNVSFHMAAASLDVREFQAFVVEKRNGKERLTVGQRAMPIAFFDNTRTGLDFVCQALTEVLP